MTKKHASSRQQINLKEVRDGVLVLPGNHYRLILETSAINFELKSEDEQDQIIDTFQNFLNGLPCPVQILIRTREIDIDGYLEDFMNTNNHERNKIYKAALEEYGQFIKKLVSGNKILTRKFYLIISTPQSGGKHDFAIVREQLKLNQDIVVKGLERLGMKSRQLGNFEILNLFYSFYNPSKIKSQPLSQTTFETLFNHADLI